MRLARGLCPGKNDSRNIVQVIPAACDDCAISSYTVTDNCHGCLGHACYESCRFGAVSIVREHGRVRAHIDPQKCRECGMCAKNCPYQVIVHQVRPCKQACPANAITMDETTGLCMIDESKCIQCGHCIHACPFGALGAKTFLVDVIQMIRAGKRVVAMVAPAVEGQFGPDITPDSWRIALKKAGFEDMIEVSLGGDMTAAAEADEWAEAFAKGESKTTSCCPAFVNMIRRHFPELSERISTSVSPMCAVSRLVKSRDPEAVTVFIGPCQAKKSEALDISISDNADYVLTFDEAVEMLRGKDIELEPAPEYTQQGSTYGKRFGNSAGVTEAVQNARAYKLMIMNLMTQDGETEGYTAADHVRELTRHSGPGVVDACLANLCPVPEHLREEYVREGAGEIELDWEEIEKLGVKLFTAPLLSDSSEYARHDPDLLAKAILELWRKEGRRIVNSRR